MNLDSFPAQLGSRLYFLFLSPSGTAPPPLFFWGHFSLAFSFMESTGRLTLHPAHTSNTERGTPELVHVGCCGPLSGLISRGRKDCGPVGPSVFFI